MSVLYPNLCYKEIPYKRTELFLQARYKSYVSAVLSTGQKFGGPCLAPFSIFGRPFEFFKGHILPSVKHNPIRFFLQKLNLFQ